MKEDKYIVYIDTGGTFSDAIIIKSDGNFVGGKASTTPENLEECFFYSIEDAANKLNKSLVEVLSSTELLGFGTTAGTNALITRIGGPKLGLITTKGFEDTTIIMKGCARCEGIGQKAIHIAGTDNPEPLVPRKLIKGVTERVDSLGRIVFPLNEEEVKEAVGELLAEGVEAIAVVTLWSFLNDVHEKRIKEIIMEMTPDIPVSISTEVAPLIREYTRFNSTIINLYIAKPVKKLFSGVGEGLKKLGYKKPFLAMQGAGGLSRADVVQPISTLNSGPIGGILGVEFLKGFYGIRNAVSSDVGGTSFDVGILPEEGPKYIREPVVGQFRLANPMLEVKCIGAGGGTVAYVDESLGLLHVGPESAGSVPGPACYDLGGTRPTVTDADVVMNRIDPNFFLGGKMKLCKEKAFKAIKEKIAHPIKIDVVEAAQAICTIVDNTMGNLVKAMLNERGLDPKGFALFAYGGAGPTHCAGYTFGSGISFKKVIIPPFAATFSAFGAATADIFHRYEASPYLVIPKLPFHLITKRFQVSSLDDVAPIIVERFNQMYQTLEQRAYENMEREGFKREELRFRYAMEARYGGQLWEGIFNSPVSRIHTVEDLRTVIGVFEDEYERLYSRGAMYPEGGLEIITLSLEVRASAIKPAMKERRYAGEDPSSYFKGKRDVFFDGRFFETKIYDMGRLDYGNIVEGPAIVEGIDTTLVVPPSCRVTVDIYRNMIMESL